MRDNRIVFKLNNEKHEQLKKMAEQTGITMSAYLAYVVGEHLRVKSQIEPMILEGMLEQVTKLDKDDQ